MWNSLFLLHADLSLPHQGAPIAYVAPPHDLVIWTDRFVPFLLGKNGSGAVANCFFCGTEATLSFRHAELVHVFLLQPVSFYMLFAVLGSTNNSAIKLLFSSFQTLAQSLTHYTLLRLSFYLKLFGTSRSNCLLFPPLLSDCNRLLGTHFFRVTTPMMSWPDRVR